MKTQRINWAINSADGTPLIVGGTIGEVDDATGAITLSDRSREVIEEVLEQNPQPTESFVIPGIDLAHEVYRLIQAKHRAGVAVRDRLPSGLFDANPTDPNGATTDDLAPDVQQAIDEVLQSLFRHTHRYLTRLGQTPGPVSMTQLRESQLGENLHWLARVARDEEQANQDDVFRAIDEVLDLLFWAPGEDHYELPRAFWTTPLGRMLAEARLHVVNKDDLMSMGEAAAALGVTRPTIYRWLGDQTLDEVYDDTRGRTFVLRDQVEHLKAEQHAVDGRTAPLTVVDKGQEMSGAARD